MTFLNGCISPVVGHPSTTQQPASHLLACLSRCLGEPAGECQRILGTNSRYLEAVERVRNAPQSQACLNRHVASFQFGQKSRGGRQHPVCSLLPVKRKRDLVQRFTGFLPI